MTTEAHTMLQPKLTYFDVRGRAEPIRLLLEETGTEYTESRITLEGWPLLKPTLAFGQLPTYEEAELLLHQSNAIYRYLGRKHNLYGDSESDRIRCEIVQECLVDAQANIAGFFWNPEFERLRDNYEKSDLPALLGRLEQLLTINTANSDYWVGSRLSYVDCIAFHFLDYVRAFSQQTLSRFERLARFKTEFESRPRIAAYLDSNRRPKTLTVPMCPFGGTPETS